MDGEEEDEPDLGGANERLVGRAFPGKTLRAELARRRIYEFLFVASPEPVTGGCSAPVNPVAVL